MSLKHLGTTYRLKLTNQRHGSVEAMQGKTMDRTDADSRLLESRTDHPKAMRK